MPKNRNEVELQVLAIHEAFFVHLQHLRAVPAKSLSVASLSRTDEPSGCFLGLHKRPDRLHGHLSWSGILSPSCRGGLRAVTWQEVREWAV